MFDEETPYKCISEVDPDVVFKGTDYKGKDVVSAGKQVEIIEIPFPIHTSDIIKEKGKTKYFNL
jgi:bifunctional ADP-heptose synthase (sugar kinase/adenylyltransferase)